MFDDATIGEIAKTAARLEVPLAALLAVAEVEAGGRVLARVRDRDEPLIRFEGHYFDRLLSGSTRRRARREGLSSSRAGKVANPRTQSGRWVLLDKATAIDRAAALSSVSWGLGQVMGSHWKWLGYRDVEALVAEARSGVAGQIELMARYIKKAGLQQALRDQNWRRFARAYNGPAYARNKYDVKMAAAYKRYARRNFSRLPAASTGDDLRFGARGGEVTQLQKALSSKGYVLVADGLFGLVTDRVLRQFQKDHGLKQTGIAGEPEWRLLKQSKDKAAAKPAEAKSRLESVPGDGNMLIPVRTGSLIGRWIRSLLSIFRRFE